MRRLLFLATVVALITLAIFLINRTLDIGHSGIKAHRYVLDNGLELVVVPSHKTPAIAHMVWYRVGGVDDPVGKSGLAHFLEHLMFKATDNLASGEFSRNISHYGGEDNAFTSKDYTAYYQYIAKDQLPMVMRMEADRMQHLRFDDAEALTERDVVVEERRSRVENHPRELLKESMRELLYEGTPYAVPLIGYMDDIISYTAHDAETFYDRYYTPNHAVVVIAGDVNPDEAYTLARDIYGPIPEKPFISRPAFPFPSSSSTDPHIEERHPLVTRAEWYRFYAAPSHHSDYSEYAYPLVVLSHLLGGGKTSYLYQELVVKQQKAISISMGYDDVSLGPSTLSLYASPAQGVALDELEDAIDHAIAAYFSKPIDTASLQRTKTLLKAEEIYAKDNFKTLAQIFGRIRVSGLPLSYIHEWSSHIDSVTRDELHHAGRFIFSTMPHVTGRLLPQEPS